MKDIPEIPRALWQAEQAYLEAVGTFRRADTSNPLFSDFEATVNERKRQMEEIAAAVARGESPIYSRPTRLDGKWYGLPNDEAEARRQNLPKNHESFTKNP